MRTLGFSDCNALYLLPNVASYTPSMDFETFLQVGPAGSAPSKSANQSQPRPSPNPYFILFKIYPNPFLLLLISPYGMYGLGVEIILIT